MAALQALLSGILLLGVAGCSEVSSDGGNPDGERQPPGQEDESTTPSVEGSLGPVTYRFDPTVLTRAEIELPLPPEFTETVFAVKFLPSSMTENIGFGRCSYDNSVDPGACTAHREIGLALALLERPIEHYRSELQKSALAASLVEGARLADTSGFAVTRHSDGTPTSLRYIFVPLGERTLLAVERTEEGIVEGEEALAAVRASISF